MYPILIFILVFAEPLLIAYLGEKYIASIPIFIVYNLILFMRVNDYRDILIASNKMRMLLISDIISFTLNIGINFMLITIYGPIGAAIATISAVLIKITLLIIFTNKVIPSVYKLLFDIKVIFSVLVTSIILSAIFKVGYDKFQTIYILPVFFALYVTFYSLIIYKLNILDKQYINLLISTFKNKLFHELRKKKN